MYNEPTTIAAIATEALSPIQTTLAIQLEHLDQLCQLVDRLEIRLAPVTALEAKTIGNVPIDGVAHPPSTNSELVQTIESRTMTIDQLQMQVQSLLDRLEV